MEVADRLKSFLANQGAPRPAGAEQQGGSSLQELMDQYKRYGALKPTGGQWLEPWRRLRALADSQPHAAAFTAGSHKHPDMSRYPAELKDYIVTAILEDRRREAERKASRGEGRSLGPLVCACSR